MAKRILILLLAAMLLLSAGCSETARSLPIDADSQTAADPSGTGDALPAGDSGEAQPDAEETDPAEPGFPLTTEETEPETDPAEPGFPLTTEETEPETDPAEPGTEPAETETDPVEPGAWLGPWEFMGESCYESGSFTDENGDEYDYDFGLPCIKDDSPAAEAINKDIDEVFGEQIREAKKWIDKGVLPDTITIGYYGQAWEDVLTLVIVEHYSFDYVQYGVYCYDTAEKTWLSTAQLLEKMGVSQEEFLSTCEDRFIRYYKDEYSEIPADRREEYGYYDGLARVASGKYVNMDLMAYPDWDGDIVVIAPIVSLAGADFYYHPIYLGMGGEG